MELKSIEFKADNVNIEERTFEGYASTWDLDKIDDVIHQGAFAKSIQEAFPKGKIKVLWEHSKPLGMPLEMREDAKGLYVKAKVSKTKLGDEALELMRDGVVSTMSIGFSIPKDKSYIDEKGVRHITEVKLFEFSPVTFPCNDEAIITRVKSLLNITKSQKLKNAFTQDIETLEEDNKKELDNSFESEIKQLNELNKKTLNFIERVLK